jgi:hypothetical protein
MMDRRTFLASLVTVVVAPVLPAPPPVGLSRSVMKFRAHAFRMLWQGENVVPLDRFDVLWGFKTVRPELACRIEG